MLVTLDAKELLAAARLAYDKDQIRSGGSVWFDDEWHEHVESGEWSVNVPAKYANLTDEIERCVNENVEWGCCGGCV